MEIIGKTIEVLDLSTINNNVILIDCNINKLISDVRINVTFINTKINEFEGISVNSYIYDWPGIDIPGYMIICGNLDVDEIIHEGTISGYNRNHKDVYNPKIIKLTSDSVLIDSAIIEDNILTGVIMGCNNVMILHDVKEVSVHFRTDNLPLIKAHQINLHNYHKHIHPDQKGLNSRYPCGTMIDQEIIEHTKPERSLINCWGDTLKIDGNQAILENCRFNKIEFDRIFILYMKNCTSLDGGPIHIQGDRLQCLQSDKPLIFDTDLQGITRWYYNELNEGQVGWINREAVVTHDIDLSGSNIRTIYLKDKNKAIDIGNHVPHKLQTYRNHDYGCKNIISRGKEFYSNNPLKSLESYSKIVTASPTESATLYNPKIATISSTNELIIGHSFEELYLKDVKILKFICNSYRFCLFNINKAIITNYENFMNIVELDIGDQETYYYSTGIVNLYGIGPVKARYLVENIHEIKQTNKSKSSRK